MPSEPYLPGPAGSDTSRTRRVFYTLDALRGIAAIAVVAMHFKQLFLPFRVPGGYLAVDLFFLMSGLVLSHAYEDRFRAGMSSMQFMRIRLIRLYPLYLLGMLLGLGVALASYLGNNRDGWSPWGLGLALLQSCLLIPNFSMLPNDRLFPLDVPCWSLFFEFLINFIFVWSWCWSSTRNMLVVCLASAIAVTIAAALFHDIDRGFTVRTFLPGMARATFGFSAGILLARCLSSGQRRKNAWLSLFTLGLVIAAFLGSPSGYARTLWDLACVLIVFPVAVFYAVNADPPPWLRSTATFLGVTSYAVYVLHEPLSTVPAALLRLLQADPTRLAPYLGIALVALFLGVSWLTHRYIDVPIRRRLTRARLQNRADGYV